MPPTAPPPARSGWLWFGIGGGVAVIVALAVALILVISGNGSDQTASPATIAGVAPGVDQTPSSVVTSPETAAPTTSPDSTELNLMEGMTGLLNQSNAGRSQLTDFIAATWGGAQCTSGSQARSMISAIQQNRDDRAAAAVQLQQQARGTRVGPIVDDFIEAMDQSKNSDDTIASWVDNYWAPYADDDGCNGPRPAPAQSYPDFDTYNSNADAAKKRVASAFNSLAGELNASNGSTFRTDWADTDI